MTGLTDDVVLERAWRLRAGIVQLLRAKLGEPLREYASLWRAVAGATPGSII